MAPVISTILMAIVSLISSGISILTVKEYRLMFMGLVIPLHLAVVIPLTLIAFLVAWLLKRKLAKANG